MKNTVVWIAEETAPFTGRWQAVGTTLWDSTVWDSNTYTSRQDCDRRVDELNTLEQNDKQLETA